MKDSWKLISAVLICEAAGALGAIFTTPQITTWYATLAKPSWNPPNWVFGPVWTTLFLLMGIALYLVWRTGLREKAERTAFRLFLAHLLLNIGWSVAFFGLESPGMGVVVIVTLLAFILYLIVKFREINHWAGWLLVPYAAWVAFATVLNIAVWRLN